MRGEVTAWCRVAVSAGPVRRGGPIAARGAALGLSARPADRAGRGDQSEAGLGARERAGDQWEAAVWSRDPGLGSIDKPALLQAPATAHCTLHSHFHPLGFCQIAKTLLKLTISLLNNPTYDKTVTSTHHRQNSDVVFPCTVSESLRTKCSLKMLHESVSRLANSSLLRGRQLTDSSHSAAPHRPPDPRL